MYTGLRSTHPRSRKQLSHTHMYDPPIMRARAMIISTLFLVTFLIFFGYTLSSEICIWINCQENCPAGFVAVPRTDGQKDELMWDHNHCGKKGQGLQRFCCPANNEIPKCRWSGYKKAELARLVATLTRFKWDLCVKHTAPSIRAPAALKLHLPPCMETASGLGLLQIAQVFRGITQIAAKSFRSSSSLLALDGAGSKFVKKVSSN